LRSPDVPGRWPANGPGRKDLHGGHLRAHAAPRGAARPILSPILRPHVGAGLRQAVRDLRRRRDRLGRRQERPARRRRSGARALRRALLHLRPGLLFRTSARIDFARLDTRILLAFFVPTLVVLGLVYVFLRVRRGGGGEPAAPAVRAITASFGNASRSAFRSPRRSTARPGSACTSRWSACIR
jgi:hypothetical protein